MEVFHNINRENLPKHVAIIMDGNGRWAEKRGHERVEGHRHGVGAVKAAAEGCAELEIDYLTLYAFSTENWERPHDEVEALMHLLVQTIHDEIDTLQENNIRLHAIGDIASLPDHTRSALLKGIKETEKNTGLTLILALNYSGRWEITQACRRIGRLMKTNNMSSNEITEELIADHLETTGIPDPSLLIRTSGEERISNFLLWQIAYTELYFCTVFWPEFRKEHLAEALREYQCRDRRFGKIETI